MANRISTILDIDDKGFKGALGSIGSSIGEADGLFGKFKAGLSSGMDVVKQNVGAFAVAGGASLVAFGVKAVGAFTETAKAAIDLSTATGLSTEEASRWLGVADDYQVSSEALQTGLGKIAKTMDSVKWAQYGIATRDAGGQARSTNDILLDSFDVLSKITNKTEQARVGQELFGKGYQSITPILGHTRAEYEKMLGAVEKGQVITDAEAAKAEKFRLAQDQLGDALKEVTLSIGQQAASLAPLLVLLAKAVDLVSKAQQNLGGYNHEIIKGTDYLASHTDEVERSGHSQEYWTKQLNAGKITAAELEKTLKALDDTTVNSQTSTQGYSYALQDVAMSAKDAEERVRDSTNSVAGYSYAAKDATDTVAGLTARNKSMTDDLERGLDRDKAAMDRLLGVVNDDESWLNLQNNFAATAALFDDKGNVIVKKGEDAAQAMRDAALAVDGLKKDVINYGVEVLGLPTERITKIVAAVDPQSLDDVDALLAALTRNRNVSLSIVAKGGAGYGSTPQFAKGGTVPGPKGRPMLAVVHGGEQVVSNEEQATGNGMGGMNVTVHVYGSVTSERDLVRSVADGIIDAQRRGEIPTTLISA